MSAGPSTLPLGLDLLIAEAKERARRRRFAALAGTSLACLAAGLVFAFRPSSSPGARVIHADGITVRIPEGWFVSRRPFTRWTDPAQRLVISSYRIPGDGFSRAPSGGASTYLPSPTGVLANVMEQLPPMRSRVWKPLGRLYLRRLGRMEAFTGQRWAELLFRLRNRDFYAFVWIGRNAAASDRQQLLSILEGMKVK